MQFNIGIFIKEVFNTLYKELKSQKNNNDEINDYQIKKNEIKEFKKDLENEENKKGFSLNKIKNKEIEFQIISKNKCDKTLEFLQKVFKEKTCPYRIVGLENVENNDYMNSVIQILKNIKSFSFKILGSEKNDEIFINFKNLLVNLFKSKEKYISPFEFKISFSLTYKIFLV